MAYEIGDCVRVKDYEEIEAILVDGYAGGVFFNPRMEQFCGAEYTISEYVNEFREPAYKLQDLGNWIFSIEMIEEPRPIEESKDLLTFLDEWKIV